LIQITPSTISLNNIIPGYPIFSLRDKNACSLVNVNYLKVCSDVQMTSVGETTTWAPTGAQGEAPPPGCTAAHPGKKFFPKKFAGVGKN